VRTTPRTGMRYYEQGDTLDVTTQDAAMMSDADTFVVGIYDTAAAGAAADGAYTGAGKTMRTGMVRTIGGFLEIYRNGAWRGVQSIELQTQVFYETTYGNGDEAGVAILNIPDYGGPVYVTVSGAVSVAAVAGAQIRAVVRLDAIEGVIASAVLDRSSQYPSGELMSLTFPAYRIGPISGAHNLIVGIRRVLGSGNWAVPAGGNQLYALITAA